MVGNGLGPRLATCAASSTPLTKVECAMPLALSSRERALDALAKIMRFMITLSTAPKYAKHSGLD